MLSYLQISFTNNFSKLGFEFAKRTFVNGREVTGAYSTALWASKNVPELFALEWRNLSNRGYLTDNVILPKTFKELLKVNNKRYRKVCLLMTVPYGTEISERDLAYWVSGLQARSTCFLERGDIEQKHVECIKAFRQAAAILIQQEFQKDLNSAKAAINANKENFVSCFKRSTGLGNQHGSALNSAINEYYESQVIKIRYLERDMKSLYLNPTDKLLLRPNLLDLPRLICFNKRDKHINKLIFRAKHQNNIINLLRFDTN